MIKRKRCREFSILKPRQLRFPVLTWRRLGKAHKAFERIETRALFYRASTELVSLALVRRTSLTIAAAELDALLLSVLDKAFKGEL